MLQLISIQVGLPVTYPWAEDVEWRSGIVKRAVSGPVWLSSLGLHGDGQADLRNHGGPNRAVNLYPAEHYDFWRQTPGLEGMTGGAFGENFTTLGLTEATACLGDVFRVGEAVVEISQPRGPCYKLDRRWNVADLSQRAEQTRRIGWYFRVLQEGHVQAGCEMHLLKHPYPQWNIQRVWEVSTDAARRAELRELVDCPALSDGWKESMRKKLA